MKFVGVSDSANQSKAKRRSSKGKGGDTLKVQKRRSLLVDPSMVASLIENGFAEDG